MRSTGLRLSEITYDVKHPIILDGRHRLVHLLLQHLHDLHYHPGADFMRAQVQQNYAFLKLRNTLREIESSCLVCRRRKAETLSPMMADLPKERAVHLEVVPTIDTNSCVMGILRFAARRGTSSVIWSDNCTNFVGSATEPVHKKMERASTRTLGSQKNTWKFNPLVHLTKGDRGSV